MMQIVNELVQGGHQVDFYIRKDGGILIQRIDGQHFVAAKGNARAREMVGASLSEAKIKQLKFATGTRKELRSKGLKNIRLPDSLWEEYKRVKKIWNKAFKAKGGKAHQAGYFSKASMRKALRDYGEEEVRRRLGEREKYASGIAYSENIRHLVDYIKMLASNIKSNEFIQLANDIQDNAQSIREEWIVPAYEALYKINKGVSPKQVAQNVRHILNL